MHLGLQGVRLRDHQHAAVGKLQERMGGGRLEWGWRQRSMCSHVGQQARQPSMPPGGSPDSAAACMSPHPSPLKPRAACLLQQLRDAEAALAIEMLHHLV